MPLSMTDPIQANDILDLKVLKDRVVYLLIGKTREELVIKVDMPQRAQIKGATVGVKAIDPLARMKVLTEFDRMALLQFADNYVPDINYYNALAPEAGDHAQAPNFPAVNSLKDSLRDPSLTFTKMAKLDIKSIDFAVAQRVHGNSHWVHAFISGLTAENGMEKLGEIVAGDLYIDNPDRFFPYFWWGGGKRPPTHEIAGIQFELKTVQNISNVIVVAARPQKVRQLAPSPGDWAPSMLDYVANDSQYKNFDKSLTKLEAEGDPPKQPFKPDYPWPGRVLASERHRKQFAEEIVEDLETLLSPSGQRIKKGKLLGKKAAKRLDDGMCRGISKLCLALEMKYHVPNSGPQGARDRWLVLKGRL